MRVFGAGIGVSVLCFFYFDFMQVSNEDESVGRRMDLECWTVCLVGLQVRMNWRLVWAYEWKGAVAAGFGWGSVCRLMESDVEGG